MRITWRKKPIEGGLAAVVQGPRGAILRVKQGALAEDVAHVAPRSVGFHKYSGWYWYASSDAFGVPLRNTSGAPVETLERAKADAEAYVRGCTSGVVK